MKFLKHINWNHNSTIKTEDAILLEIHSMLPKKSCRPKSSFLFYEKLNLYVFLLVSVKNLDCNCILSIKLSSVCSVENLTKRSGVLLLRLVRFSAEQTLLTSIKYPKHISDLNAFFKVPAKMFVWLWIRTWNPSIYNMIRWVTWTYRRPSVWCSKYVFFMISCKIFCKNSLNLFSYFFL